MTLFCLYVVIIMTLIALTAADAYNDKYYDNDVYYYAN